MDALGARSLSLLLLLPALSTTPDDILAGATLALSARVLGADTAAEPLSHGCDSGAETGVCNASVAALLDAPVRASGLLASFAGGSPQTSTTSRTLSVSRLSCIIS